MRHLTTLKYIDAVAKSGSIRSAAENLAITPSALNRRILALEEELGVEVFERHATGVHLNSAGEILIQHIRSQIADLERVKSRIADLSGLRLGHVRIAATPDTMRYFLPRAIAAYRAEFPRVTFEVNAMNRENIEAQLLNHEADILIAFHPRHIPNVQVLLPAPQPIHIVVSKDHPLARKKSVKLVDCMEYGLLLPNRGDGIREMLEEAAGRKGLQLSPVVESGDPSLLESLARENGGVSFTIALAISTTLHKQQMAVVPLHPGEMETGYLIIGQLRNRALPVAAAKFVEDIRKSIATMLPADAPE